MLFGDPYKFGFLIERVKDWEYPPFVNGLMFMYVNSNTYPKELRTTTLSTELPELLDDDSPLVAPKKDKRLFYAGSEERFEYLTSVTYPDNFDNGNDLSYLVPFHEISDSGYSVFTLTDGDEVLVTIGKWSFDKLIPVDEITIPASTYREIINKLLDFYKTLPKEKASPERTDRKEPTTPAERPRKSAGLPKKKPKAKATLRRVK